MRRRLYIAVAVLALALAGALAATALDAFAVSGLPSWNNGAAGGSAACSFTARNGDLIVYAQVSYNVGISAPTDTLGNTWSQAGTTLFDSTSGQRLAIYYAIAGSGGSDTVTGTTSQYVNSVCEDVTGLKPSATYDVSACQAQPSAAAGADVISSSAAAGALAGDYIFGIAADQADGAISGAGTGYQQGEKNGGNGSTIELLGEHAVIPDSGSVAATFNRGSNLDRTLACVVGFKAANPPTATTTTTTVPSGTVTETITQTVTTGGTTTVAMGGNCGGTTTDELGNSVAQAPCAVQLDADTGSRLDLTWWGVWALGGLMLTLIIAPMWQRAWKWWRD